MIVIALASAAGGPRTWIHEFPHPRLVVHYHPNTGQFRLAELKSALEKGVNAVELDLHLRESDGKVVCNHNGATAQSPTLAEALDVILAKKGTADTVNRDGRQFFVVLEPKQNSPRLFDAIAELLTEYQAHLSTAVGPTDKPRGITAVITGSYTTRFYAHFKPDVINRLCITERHNYEGEITNLSKGKPCINWVSIRHSRTAGDDAKRVRALHEGTDPALPGTFNVRIWDCHKDLAVGLAAGADSLNCDIDEIEVLHKMLKNRVTIEAAPAPELDALFARTSGWIGADGDYSVPLGENRTLWLFSDTFVGDVKEGKRVGATMINNSVAILQSPSPTLGERGPRGVGKPAEFFYKTGQDGRPASFVTPDDGRGYFWLFDGIMTSKGLYMFLPRVEHSDDSPAFPFRLFGMRLGHVPKPSGSPLDWKIAQRDVPFSRFERDRSIFFGSAVTKVGSEVYIYGLDARRVGEPAERRAAMIVARVPEDEFGDFGAWRFYSSGEWTWNWENCDRLFEGCPTEYSVSYVPGIEQYAAVYTEGGIFGNIMVRFAPRPEGPWGEPIKAFDCPDKRWHEKAYSYAAKAHPELATSPNELIVTYATNSTNFPDLFDDARLYWPRFVRLIIAGGG